MFVMHGWNIHVRLGRLGVCELSLWHLFGGLHVKLLRQLQCWQLRVLVRINLLLLLPLRLLLLFSLEFLCELPHGHLSEQHWPELVFELPCRNLSQLCRRHELFELHELSFWYLLRRCCCELRELRGGHLSEQRWPNSLLQLCRGLLHFFLR